MILIGLSAEVPSRHGSPEEVVLLAKDALEKNQIAVKATSSVWLEANRENGFGEYFPASLVLSIDTHLYPLPLLALLQDIESEFGRIHGFKNDHKSVEFFLISYKREVFKNDYLTLPYPQLHEQTNFLLPLSEIYSDWVHPYFNEPLKKLLDKRDNKNNYISESELKSILKAAKK